MKHRLFVLALAVVAATSAKAQFAASLIFRAGDDDLVVTPGEAQATAVILTDGGVAVDILMSGRTRFDFSVLTANHVGDPMPVILCDTVLSAPVVTARIDSGRAAIRAPNLATADALAAIINGEETCAAMPI